MIDYVGGEAELSGDPSVVRAATKVLLPGVGWFAHDMHILVQRGLDEAIRDAVAAGSVLLGVCLGMQLLGRRSEEGDADGLGLIAGDVRRLTPSDPALKVPNIGWHKI